MVILKCPEADPSLNANQHFILVKCEKFGKFPMETGNKFLLSAYLEASIVWMKSNSGGEERARIRVQKRVIERTEDPEIVEEKALVLGPVGRRPFKDFPMRFVKLPGQVGLTEAVSTL